MILKHKPFYYYNFLLSLTVFGYNPFSTLTGSKSSLKSIVDNTHVGLKYFNLTINAVYRYNLWCILISIVSNGDDVLVYTARVML